MVSDKRITQILRESLRKGLNEGLFDYATPEDRPEEKKWKYLYQKLGENEMLNYIHIFLSESGKLAWMVDEFEDYGFLEEYEG